MVSGLVTSPCDQLRILSGDARLMRIESKSVIVVPRSNGLERYKVSSCGFYATASAPGPHKIHSPLSTPAGMQPGVERARRTVSQPPQWPLACVRPQEF